MRIINYSLMIMMIVVTAFATENFIQKKSVKKQPRIKQEDIVMRNGELLKETAQLLKEIAQIQETILNDTHEIVEQQKNGYFSNASQQDLRAYECCASKMQHSIKECAQSVRAEYQNLKERRHIK